jgi:hypothetical protein
LLARVCKPADCLFLGSEVVPSAADRTACHAEQGQNDADKQDNNADRPGNCDVRDEADDEKQYADNYHLAPRGLVAVMGAHE